MNARGTGRHRLPVLSAAAALQEFTVPQAAAYAGCDPASARQILDGAHRYLRVRHGARPMLWHVTDMEALLGEIARIGERPDQDTRHYALGLLSLYPELPTSQLRHPLRQYETARRVLQQLRREGLVVSERRGRELYWRLAQVTGGSP